VKADKALIEAVAVAIEQTRFGSRFNDWTSDHVPGLPIEIFKLIDDTDAVVVMRYPAHVGEAEALRQHERTQQAIAALRAAGFEIDGE